MSDNIQSTKLMVNAQSRKWQLTINNPIEHGFDHEKIMSYLRNLTTVIYYCISDEVGEQGTFHTHIFLYSPSPIRFKTIKYLFPVAHMDPVRGSCAQNRDYVFKTGEYLNSPKAEGNILESHKEYGDLPLDDQGTRYDLKHLYTMINEGKKDAEILEINPGYFSQIDRMGKVRQTILQHKYQEELRMLDVTYIWGDSGSGKTRGVLEEHGIANVYRVTDYAHPFDGYESQPVIVFEEFRNSLSLSCMLNYLDIYPLQLPCRYYNRFAAYTKVYLITNIDLRDQYKDAQTKEPESWKAFLRRIHHIKVYRNDKVYEFSREDYMNGFIPVEFVEVPFKQ